MPQRRALAIVYNGNQLMFAAQIKHTHSIDYPMDIAYVNMNIDEEAARGLFDGVFKCKAEKPPKWCSIRCFFFPEWAIKNHYSNIEPYNYTDIFFWHDSWIFYFLYKYSIVNKHEYKWHLLPEGGGAYWFSASEIEIPPKEFGYWPLYRFFKLIDRRFFEYPVPYGSLAEDVYMIRPEFAVIDDSVCVISMPGFEPDDKNFVVTLSRTLLYRCDKIINKVIVLDGAHNGSRREYYDVDKMDELICELGERLGKKNVILKRKHGIGLDQYNKRVVDSVTFYEDEDVPWELVCLNDSIRNCIIISVASSASILPYVFCGFEQPTYRIESEFIEYRFGDACYQKDCELYDKVVKKNVKYSYIHSHIDIEKVLKEYHENLLGSGKSLEE